MAINSRQKGKRGEREWAKFLTSKGYSARRGQQFSGGCDSPDVVCPSLPFHWEVKRNEALDMYSALNQALYDSSPEKIPAVAYKKNRKNWIVIMEAECFLGMCKAYFGSSNLHFSEPISIIPSLEQDE